MRYTGYLIAIDQGRVIFESRLVSVEGDLEELPVDDATLEFGVVVEEGIGVTQTEETVLSVLVAVVIETPGSP